MDANISRQGESLIRRCLVPLAAYTILSLVVFWPILKGDLLLHRDLIRSSNPHRWLAGQLWRVGVMPLWNSSVGFGTPLLADPNAGVLDPLIVLFCLPIHPYVTGTLMLWLRYILAGVAMHRFLRTTGHSQMASYAGGGVYLLSGMTMGSWTSVGWAHCWMYVPLAMTLPHVRGTVLGRGLAAGSLFALMLFDGVIEPVAFSLLLWSVELRQAGRGITECAIGILSFIGLALIQILPLAEMFLLSERSGGLVAAEVLSFSISPLELLGVVLPVSFTGDHGGAAPAGMYGSFLQPLFFSTYVGASVLMVVFLSPIRKRNALFLALIFLCTALSMGKYLPGYTSTLEIIPLLRALRYPVKFLFFLPPCSAVLVAGALETLPALTRARKLAAIGSAFTGIMVLCLFGMLSYRGDPAVMQYKETLKSAIAVGAQNGFRMFLAAALLVLACEFSPRRRIWPVLLAACLLLDLGTAARRTIFFFPPEMAETPVLRSGLPESWPRIISALSYFHSDRSTPTTPQDKEAMLVATGMPHMVRHAEGYSSFRRGTFTRWWNSHIEQTPKGLAFLGAMGVKYLMCDTPIFRKAESDGWIPVQSSGRLRSWRNPRILPEIRFYSGVEPPSYERFLEPGDPVRVKADHYLNGDLDLEMRVDSPGWLVRTEAWAPGWVVSEDGAVKELPLMRIPLQLHRLDKAGDHRLRFHYAPLSFTFGLWSSLACAILSVIAFALEKKRSSYR